MYLDTLCKLFHQYPMPENVPKYGTSGFRTDATLLDAVVIRASVLMTLRSKQIQKSCGIMITASHNPENDNGLKLIDYTGDMINEQFERYAVELAMCKTFDDFISNIHRIITECNISIDSSFEGFVYIGRDTRRSGNHLFSICKEAVYAAGGYPMNAYYVSTPELHYIVAKQNNTQYKSNMLNSDYIDNLMSSFDKLYQTRNSMILHVDCANGVGALKMLDITERLLKYNIKVQLYNTSKNNLNHLCGADFVEKNLTFPTNMDTLINENDICCSLDGDADRIVFFSKNKGKFVLLNGDRIACLIVKYLYNQFENIEKDMKMCVVHTPYANGAFLTYIRDMFPYVHLQCAETGVKYLHRTAKQYDIGVYFESNGHGSVHFSENCLKDKKVSVISNLLSQYTGDALGDMLFVLVALQQTSFLEWMYMYQDYPCKQLKLYGNKSIFTTTDFGRKLIQPFGLQNKLDSITSNYSHSNCFVRPSGTEDLLRLYVECKDEASIQEIVDSTVSIISTYTPIQVA